MDALSQCRAIARMGTGTDKIDVGRATELGIVVANTPAFCVEEQADHAMAMVLSLARKLTASQNAMAAGTILLGYLKSPSEEPDATPVCVIRQANERDLATLREVRSECELGDWFVMGEIDQRELLSQPIKTLEEAKAYARDFFEASSFDTGYPMPDQEGAKA